MSRTSREQRLGLGVPRPRIETSYLAAEDLQDNQLVALVRRSRYRVGPVTPLNQKRAVGAVLFGVRADEVVIVVSRGTARLRMR